MTKNQNSFENMARELAKIYNIEGSGDLSEADYEKQVKSPQFIKTLVFNCLLMNSLYKCRKGGCVGCKAENVFRTTEDPETLRMLDAARAIMDKEA